MTDVDERGYALITGASAGLGLEFARQIAATGLNLILCARRQAPMLTAAKQLKSEHAIDVQVLVADLSTLEGPEQLWWQIQSLGLRVDLLINNAGSAGGNLLKGAWSDHRAQLNLMTQSVAALCHLAIPPMLARGHGQVLNVASVAGRLAETRDSSYGPTKSYVIALSQGLAHETRARGLTVMALCPGFTHTAFHHQAGMQAIKQSTPSFLWYDAETVVREGLQALADGKTVYISGRVYRWLDPLLRIGWLQRLLQRGM